MALYRASNPKINISSVSQQSKKVKVNKGVEQAYMAGD